MSKPCFQLSNAGRPGGWMSPLALVVLLAAGCQKPEITSYRAPKDVPTPAPEVAQEAAPMVPKFQRPKAQVAWKLPTGWQESTGNRMSVASFAVEGANGQSAQISITPLPLMKGRDSEIINMWREQVGQGALSQEDAQKSLQPVAVGTEQGQMFEVSGHPSGGGEMKIVTAIVHRANASWFYKLQGDAAVVNAQTPAFVDFLKSIQIKEAPAEDVAEAAPADQSGFHWKVPANWKAVAAGQMQVAKFTVPAQGEAKADVMVSIFPSDTGGTLANVNRWRRQIGLAEITEADLAGIVKPLDASNREAVVVDMTNNARQLIGAIVPRNGQWFFYKLLGDAAAAAPAKEAFVNFVKSEP